MSDQNYSLDLVSVTTPGGASTPTDRPPSEARRTLDPRQEGRWTPQVSDEHDCHRHHARADQVPVPLEARGGSPAVGSPSAYLRGESTTVIPESPFSCSCATSFCLAHHRACGKVYAECTCGHAVSAKRVPLFKVDLAELKDWFPVVDSLPDEKRDEYIDLRNACWEPERYGWTDKKSKKLGLLEAEARRRYEKSQRAEMRRATKQARSAAVARSQAAHHRAPRRVGAKSPAGAQGGQQQAQANGAASSSGDGDPGGSGDPDGDPDPDSNRPSERAAVHGFDSAALRALVDDLAELAADLYLTSTSSNRGGRP